MRTWVKRLHGLEVRQPHLWPVAWKWCLLTGAGFLLWLVLEFIFIADLRGVLQNLQIETQELDKQIQLKREKAALLQPLSSEVQALQDQMRKLSSTLPDKAHWDELLSELNQAGRRHKVALEWFKPEAARVSSQWVELPASIRVKGAFHAMGGFISELAHSNHWVALEQLSLEAGAKDTVTLHAKLKAFRQRSPAEAAAFREEKSVTAVEAAWTLDPTHYEGSHRPDPFKPHATQVASTIVKAATPPSQAGASSAKHPLEMTPLDTMRLVGQLRQGDRSVGLIRLKGAVYPARVGTVLGTNQGRVSSVDSSGLVVLENSTDASGRQSQRSTFIPMTRGTP
jgi:type IV pilus assembly protein PilO